MSDDIQSDRSKKPAQDEYEDQDQPRARRRPRGDEDDPDRFRKDETGGLIPYRNPKALIAYYCGVFSLIPCAGAVLGPVALILGILGLGYHKKHPSAGGMAHAIVGIVLGGLSTLGHLGVILLAVVGGALSATH